MYRNDYKIKYYIGYTRNKRSVDSAMPGVYYVFQAASFKQVPSSLMTCPVCNSTKYNTLYVINSEESVKHLLKKTDEIFITLQNYVKSLWHGDECSII